MASGVNGIDLRDGICMAVDDVVRNLKSMARMINTFQEIAQVPLNLQLVTFCTFSFLLETHYNLSIALFRRWVLYQLMVKGKLVSSLQRLWRRLAKRELSPLR